MWPTVTKASDSNYYLRHNVPTNCTPVPPIKWIQGGGVKRMEHIASYSPLLTSEYGALLSTLKCTLP
jgi:hypothetical protein